MRADRAEGYLRTLPGQKTDIQMVRKHRLEALASGLRSDHHIVSISPKGLLLKLADTPGRWQRIHSMDQGAQDVGKRRRWVTKLVGGGGSGVKEVKGIGEDMALIEKRQRIECW